VPLDGVEPYWWVKDSVPLTDGLDQPSIQPPDSMSFEPMV